MATLLDDRQVVNRAALSALGNTANQTLDVTLPLINTFFANATSLPTASVLMKRDANANTQANNFIENFTTTITGATTTTLTVASSGFQEFTGTAIQTVVLPNATTLVVGQAFTIANRSTGNVTVQTNGGANLQVLTANSQATFTVATIGTSAGTWDVAYSISGPIPFLQTQVVTDATTTGSAATTLSTDTNFGTVRLTNGSLVSLSGVVAGASGQYITIENQTGNLILVNNNDSGATAANRIFTGTGSNITMSNNASFTFVYDSTQSRWMLIGGTGSGNGSGSGKNYLSSVVTSQSTTPNTGNGNFELGSTTGWSLAHSALTSSLPTTVGSAGFSFSAAGGSHGGSAAHGTLGFVINSFAPLAGTYSAILVESGTAVPGDMVISDAFNIDTEDQAKPLTVKFYYENNNGANSNFSGTSSNTYAVYVYDVTNAAWIQPAGVYGMTQGTGPGYCTATFQTTSNSTQYQLAVVILQNSSTPSITLDDFSVGPQTAPLGVPATDWTLSGATVISATTTAPTKGTATIVADNMWYRRNGADLEVRLEYKQTAPGSATSGSGDYLFQLPTGFTIDTTKLTAYSTVIGTQAAYSATNAVGVGNFSASSAPGPVTVVVYDSTHVRLFYQDQNTTFTGGSVGAIGSGNAGLATAGTVNFVATFKVPISGWSSNVQMSNDTDTRVVSFNGTNASQSVTGGTTNLAFTTAKDSHGAWSGTTYTVPVSGDYILAASGISASAASSFVVYKNGSQTQYQFGEAASGSIGSGSLLLPNLNAGDTLNVRMSTTTTLTSSILNIFRLSGPSVIAATESVNMVYNTSTTAGNATTPFIYTNKIRDSHSGYNVSNGKYTVPVSGFYSVCAGINTASPGTFDIGIRQNGTVIFFGGEIGALTNASVAGMWPFNAGDLIDVVPTSAVTANTTANVCYFMISRLGN